MEKLLKFYPRFLFFIGLICFASCQPDYQFYKKSFSEKEKSEQAERLVSGMGYRYYYQGSTGELALVEEAAFYNNQHPEVWRERGIPFLKRGIVSGYMLPYTKAAELDPLNWLGYKGYCTLYFYRDYKRALADFDKLDPLTPDFVDYPQATSIDYMRAICYAGLNQPEKALEFIDKHIASETKEVGLNYVASTSFIIKGKAHLQRNEVEQAQAAFELGLEAHDKNAELNYYLAKLLHGKGQRAAAKKYATKAKTDFQEGYSNSRPYVEEFHQVYLADIEELLALL